MISLTHPSVSPSLQREGELTPPNVVFLANQGVGFDRQKNLLFVETVG